MALGLRPGFLFASNCVFSWSLPVAILTLSDGFPGVCRAECARLEILFDVIGLRCMGHSCSPMLHA